MTLEDFIENPKKELDEDELEAIAGGECYCVGAGGGGVKDYYGCACVGGGYGGGKEYGKACGCVLMGFGD